MKKLTIGAGIALVLTLTVVITAFAQTVTVIGTVAAIDSIGKTFAMTTEDMKVYIVRPPVGFDWTTLMVGDIVEVTGESDGISIVATSITKPGDELPVDEPPVVELLTHDEILDEFHVAKNSCMADWRDALFFFRQAKHEVPQGDGHDEDIATLEAEKDAAEALKDECIAAAEAAKDAALATLAGDGDD